MFTGHYGIAYAVKKKREDIPLWVLFIAVQLTDIAAYILVLIGIERAAYMDNPNPFLRNDLYLPYSHSLSGTFLLALAAAGLCRLFKRGTWTLPVVLCVVSHWGIDFIVHNPDMSLFFGKFNTGLGLWNHVYVSYGLEIIMITGGWLLVRHRNPVSWLLLFLMAGTVTGMVFASEPTAFRNSEALRTAVVLAINLLIIALSYVSEKIEMKKQV